MVSHESAEGLGHPTPDAPPQGPERFAKLLFVGVLALAYLISAVVLAYPVVRYYIEVSGG